MFIVAIEGKKQIFLNNIQDDFLRLLPAQYDVEPSDIEAWYIPENDQKQLRKILKQNGHNTVLFDCENSTLVKVIPAEFTPGQIKKVEPTEGNPAGEVIVTAEMDEAKPVIETLYTFNTKKVKEVLYEMAPNQITGKPEPTLKEYVLEE